MIANVTHDNRQQHTCNMPTTQGKFSSHFVLYYLYSNIDNRLAFKWHTPIKRSEDGVLGCPSLSLSGQKQASAMYQFIPKVSMVLSS